jgi:hypothetical protein
VLVGGPKLKIFSAVLRECASVMRLVVDEKLHANGDNRLSAVVVLAIYVYIG